MRVLIAILCSMLVLQGSGQTTDEIANGTGLANYHDISGSALIFKDWAPGVIKFTSGRVTNQFKLKFDCIANKVLMQYKGNSFSSESKIREFVIYPKGFISPDSMVFRNGFPANGAANEETYYQVLVEDSASLLKLVVKIVNEERQIASNIVYRRIKDEEHYYLLKSGKLTDLTVDKSLLPDLFGEKKEQIGSLIDSKNLKFRSAADYIELVKFYNNL